MKYSIEVKDNKVIETLEVQGNKFTATWKEGDDDGTFCSYHTVGKSLEAQIQEAFEYDDELAMDVEELVPDSLIDKFFDFLEAWGEE